VTSTVVMEDLVYRPVILLRINGWKSGSTSKF